MDTGLSAVLVKNGVHAWWHPGENRLPSSPQLWEVFFSRYYEEAIIELAENYPEKRSLVVGFSDIERFDMDLAQELLDHPDGVLQHANQALQVIDLPTEIEFKNTHVQVAGCPEKVRRRDIRQEHVGKLITVSGVVQRITEVAPKLLIAAFVCQRCNHTTEMPQGGGRFVEPFECDNDLCGRKGPFELNFEESKNIDSQKIRIQELTEDLKGGEKSQTIDVDINDDLAGIVLPGNKVTITGILRAYQRVKAGGKSTYFDLSLDAVHIQINEGQETITLTPEDVDRMREIAAHPGVVDYLVSAFASTVEGMDEIKEGILCCAVGNGYRLRHDGTPQREYSHMLVCTDPGMAKSNLKHATKKLIPGVVLSSGTGATKAGLTAAAVKDDFANGSWSIEVGVLPLADTGGALIDEFDKMNDTDKNKINDALSNCQFEINKAGFNMKLWTRMFLIAFCNPKDGRFDTYTNVVEQINLTPDTISRFDLIFTMHDKVETKNDNRIARKMASAWLGEGGPEMSAIQTEELQKYLVFAKSVRPVLGRSVADAAISQYVHARGKSQDGRIAVTTRYLESLFRLAKAEAQLCLSATVELEHFRRAVRLLEASVLQVGLDENGNPDADIIATGMGHDQRAKIKTLVSIIRGIQDDNRGAAPLGEILLFAEAAGIKASAVKDMLLKLKTNGSLLEVSNDRFRVC